MEASGVHSPTPRSPQRFLTLRVIEATDTPPLETTQVTYYCRASYDELIMGRTPGKEGVVPLRWDYDLILPVESLEVFSGGYITVTLMQQEDEVVGATRVPVRNIGQEHWYPLIRNIKAGWSRARLRLALSPPFTGSGVVSPTSSLVPVPSHLLYEPRVPLEDILSPIPGREGTALEKLLDWSGGQEEVLYIAGRVWHTPSETVFAGETSGHLCLTDLRLIFLPGECLLGSHNSHHPRHHRLIVEFSVGAIQRMSYSNRRVRTEENFGVAMQQAYQILTVVLRNGRTFNFRVPARLPLWSRIRPLSMAFQVLGPTTTDLPSLMESCERVCHLFWDEVGWLRAEGGFAQKFAEYFYQSRRHVGLCIDDENDLLLREYSRLGLPNSVWTISQVNATYNLCSTYPPLLALPAALQDDFIASAGPRRSKSRIPVMVWLHPENQAPLCRCSQPQRLNFVDFSSDSQLASDEVLITEIRKAAAHTNCLQILDARPRLNAHANVLLLGKGIDDVDRVAEDGTASMRYMNIDNIHKMRDSLQRLSSGFYQPDGDLWSAVGNSKWLHHVRSVLQGSVEVAECLNRGEAVLIHCSDGWDRTSQLSSLGQLFLDPYFRTFKGFAVLVQKEWAELGHKFEDRLYSGTDEQSPVFLQFLDAVFQLTQQFPTAFEFSPRYLLVLADAAYSRCFLTFLGNCTKDRIELLGALGQGPSFFPCTGARGQRPISVWTFIEALLQCPYLVTQTSVVPPCAVYEPTKLMVATQEDPTSDLRNPLYRPRPYSLPSTVDPLIPCTDTQALRPWVELYIRDLPRVVGTVDVQPHEHLEELVMAKLALFDWIGRTDIHPALSVELRRLQLVRPTRKGPQGAWWAGNGRHIHRGPRQEAARKVQRWWKKKKKGGDNSTGGASPLSHNYHLRSPIHHLALLEAREIIKDVIDAACVIAYRGQMAKERAKICAERSIMKQSEAARKSLDALDLSYNTRSTRGGSLEGSEGGDKPSSIWNMFGRW